MLPSLALIAACTLARPGVEATIGLARDLAAPAARPKAGDGTGFLQRVADVPLPGAAVRFDYQSADPGSERLYLSHMKDDHVVVLDTRARRVVSNIPGMAGVTGVWVVPDLHRLYSSLTGAHRVAVIDIPALSVRATVGPIGYPDGIAYAPGVKRVFVSDEAGGGELVIDGLTDRVLAMVPLGGEAGNTKYDAGSGCILVAVQTRNEIVAIDPETLTIVARFALAKGDHPHGMQVDPANRRLFVANQGNATMEIVDLKTLEVTDIEPVGEEPDVLALDPGHHRLYVATERGGLWWYRVDGRRMVPRGILDLPHAHTVSVDPASHLVYLPLENLAGKPVLRIFKGTDQPAP